MREGDHSKVYTWEKGEDALQDIFVQSYEAARQIITLGKLEKGDVLVVGCSTSEVCGAKIGSESRPEVAEKVFEGIYKACQQAGVNLAAQCCEHLNRAIIIERKIAKEKGLEIVNVVPTPKAGGSFATEASKVFEHAAAVEHIKADAGLDIGDTLIGMHLKDVAVPVRLNIASIGQAHLVAARTRAKYIGGSRAAYDPKLG